MSQQPHDTKGREDDKGQEQSCPAPLQQIPAVTAMSATRMSVPAAPATGSADTEMSPGVENTTTGVPVRVQGQKQNIYHSVPLSRGQIRLLQLLPHENEDAAIHCRLFRTALDSKGTRPYEALSYVWGSRDEPRSIFVNGRDLTVGESLYAALLRLRDPSIERTMWIDAICINQEDPEEKGHQVQSMAKIYAKATRVIVWLGEEAADSDRALETIRTAAELSIGRSDDKAGILALLQRPWFQRIWVLQEVAAARHILIKCGSAEVDGFAFCSGLNALNLFDELRADLEARILSVTYLIRGAIFRPKYATTCQTDNFSLDIRPLHELIEMYHTRKATDRRDKVYALLGMSSDDPTAAGLSADYTLSWKQLFKKLIHISLSQLVSVDVSDDKGIAVIEGKGCVLGEVSSVERNPTWEDRRDVTISWTKAWSICRYSSSLWTLPITAKPIQKGDAVCLLLGASKPTILRPCNYYWAVIMIAVSIAEDSKTRDREMKWSELIELAKEFPHLFRLKWDWDMDPGRQQDQNNHGYFASISEPEHSWTGLEGCLDTATRIQNVRLALQDGRMYEAGQKHLREEMAVLERALRSMNTLEKDSLSPDDSEKEDAKKLETMVNQLIEEKGTGQLLSLAAENGHETFVEFLLDTDKVNLPKCELETVLWLATRKGYRTIVELLLDTGQVDAHPQSWDGETVLHLAALNGHGAVVKLLLDTGKVDANARDKYGTTPLHIAAGYKYSEAVVKLLLDTGKVDVNARAKYGKTSLHIAARHEHSEAVVKLLLDTGKVEANDQDDEGKTALHYAAENGHGAVVKLLLDTGRVDVNFRNWAGRTALHGAAENGHEGVAKLLLDSGKVDINLQDCERKTALHTAVEGGYKGVVKLLLDSGKVDINLQDYKRKTALHTAVKGGYKGVVKLLLDTGKVDINLQCNMGKTALHYAAAYGYEAVVKLLLDTGKVDINLQGDMRETALHTAVEGGYEGVVKLLLDTGKVDLHSLDRLGKTALDYARRREHEAIVELLSHTSKEAGLKGNSTSS